MNSKKQFSLGATIFASVVMLHTGCDSQTGVNVTATDAANSTGATADGGLQSVGPSGQTEIRFSALNDQQWTDVLAAEKGKFVVVDTWATWCIPCVEEFPKLVAMNEKYSQSGVTCMSVSVDSPDDDRNIVDFLKTKKSTMANYRFEDANVDWWDKWDIKGIPVVLVFDQSGNLLKKFDNDDPDNQFSYEDVESFVVELLNR